MRLTRASVCLLLALVIGGLPTAGCRRRKPRDWDALETYHVDGERALELTGELVDLGPRHSNSPGAARTAGFIKERCDAMGYAARLDTWQEETAHGEWTFHNVYAELDGRGRDFVVVASHFDTKRLAGVPLFQGANDSGSSTALLLEIMRVLHKADWDGPPLFFAFFDGEECLVEYGDNDGLHGSKHLAAALARRGRLERCRAMVLLDMIGDRDLQLTLSPDDDPELIRRVQQIAARQGVQQHVTIYDHTILDDHVPFKDRGIPAIDLIDFEFGPNNTYWHTSADRLDKLDARSFQIVGDLTIRLLQTLTD